MKYGVISLVLYISTRLRLVTILSLLVKYLVILHADLYNKSYIYMDTKTNYITLLTCAGWVKKLACSCYTKQVYPSNWASEASPTLGCSIKILQPSAERTSIGKLLRKSSCQKYAPPTIRVKRLYMPPVCSHDIIEMSTFYLIGKMAEDAMLQREVKNSSLSVLAVSCLKKFKFKF